MVGVKDFFRTFCSTFKREVSSIAKQAAACCALNESKIQYSSHNIQQSKINKKYTMVATPGPGQAEVILVGCGCPLRGKKSYAVCRLNICRDPTQVNRHSFID